MTADGVLAMGIGAGLILIGTRASVDALVVLYAINVFVTFTLSQLGMTVHWWKVRKSERNWIRKILVNGIGTLHDRLDPDPDADAEVRRGRMGDGADHRRADWPLPAGETAL